MYSLRVCSTIFNGLCVYHMVLIKSDVTSINVIFTARKVWSKVIFLHLSVILFMGGVPGQVPPWVGTPLAGTPPWAGTSPGRYTPSGRYTPQQCMLGYTQQVGDMHDTGMYSYLFVNLLHVACSHCFHDVRGFKNYLWDCIKTTLQSMTLEYQHYNRWIKFWSLNFQIS